MSKCKGQDCDFYDIAIGGCTRDEKFKHCTVVDEIKVKEVKKDYFSKDSDSKVD